MPAGLESRGIVGGCEESGIDRLGEPFRRVLRGVEGLPKRVRTHFLRELEEGLLRWIPGEENEPVLVVGPHVGRDEAGHRFRAVPSQNVVEVRCEPLVEFVKFAGLGCVRIQSIDGRDGARIGRVGWEARFRGECRREHDTQHGEQRSFGASFCRHGRTLRSVATIADPAAFDPPGWQGGGLVHCGLRIARSMALPQALPDG